jgi:Fic family protein
LHPAVIAAIFHHRFGRLGRILMNLILMQHGYPPAIIQFKDRNDYFDDFLEMNQGKNVSKINRA